MKLSLILILLYICGACNSIFIMNNASFLPETMMGYNRIGEFDNCSLKIYEDYNFLSEGHYAYIPSNNIELCIVYTADFIVWNGPYKVNPIRFVILDNKISCQRGACNVNYMLEVY